MAITKVAKKAEAALQVADVLETTQKTMNDTKVGELVGQLCSSYAITKSFAVAEAEKTLAFTKKQILAEIDEVFGDTEPVTLKYEGGIVCLSPCSNDEIVTDLKALHDLLGDGFYDVIKVSMTDLRKKLSPKELESVPIITTVGSRKFSKIIPA